MTNRADIPYRTEIEPRHAPGGDPVADLLVRLAWLMDRAVAVPGTRLRIGLDAVLGLLPIGGDAMTGLVQTALVLVALSRYHVPKTVAARMMGNVLLDVAVGAIPLLGDLFDVAFKANTRNLHLLEPYLPAKTLPAPVPAPSAATTWGCIVGVAVVLLGALSLVLIGFVTVVRWLIQSA